MYPLHRVIGAGLRLAMVIVLAGCGGAKEERSAPAGSAGNRADGPPVQGDWVIHHQLADPDFLNPVISRGAGASVIEGFIYESLMRSDNRTLKLEPHIALDHPDVSADKRSYTYRLRKDVFFEDGTPLTGEDVVFSLKTIKNPYVDDAPLRNYYASVLKVELVAGDRYTVRFLCDEPYINNDLFLGGMAILPRHVFDAEGLLDEVTFEELADPDRYQKNPKIRAFGEQFNKHPKLRHPVGSGPYRFAKWDTNQQIVLVRNDAYWGKDLPYYTAYLDKLVFRTINDTQAALVSLKNQDLDFMILNPLQYEKQTSSKKFAENFRKDTFYIPRYDYIGWNNEHPPFNDKRVRQAMTYLIDREELVKTLLYGRGRVVASPVFFKKEEFDSNLKPYPYDPARGVKLLEEAGWIDRDGDGVREKVINGKSLPFQFTFLINSGNEVRKKVGLIVSENLKKVGIHAEVRELEWSVFLNNVSDHQFDATVLAWAMPLIEKYDPFQVWHSSSAENRGSNAIGFRNQRVDQILEENRVTFDDARRITLIHEFQQILHEEQPYTFLWTPMRAVAVHTRFRGVEWFAPRPGYDLSEWWVPLKMQRYGEGLHMTAQ